MENAPRPLDRRVKSFYLMAEEYGDVDAKEISPSFYSLKKTTQRYQAHELLASGGMKQIYKVYDARTKRHLAMALLHADAPEDLFDPFIHEAWLTALLDHPNIITMHDIGVNVQDRPYFTMDLKQGDSLRELIEKRHSNDRKTQDRYPLESLLQIFMKICDAVAYAHSNQVLHLDLKPSNIQVGDYGQVLVCDWGLGRVVGGGDPRELDRQLFNPDLFASTNLLGELKGTPGYMAPEQLVEDGAVDIRTDIYGLGCILYSLLTLLRPVSGNGEEILKQMKEEAIVPPQRRMPKREVPASLNAVVMKALAVDPKNRYASVNALRTEVHRYLTGFATQAEEAGVSTQLRLFYRRNRRFCLTLFSAACIIVSGTVFSFYNLRKKERVATAARQEVERTLALYEAGRTELETMTSRNAESVVALATRYEIEGRVDGARAVLKTALEQEPENPVYLRAMGLHYFVEQRFVDANRYLGRAGDGQDVINVLCREYAALKADGALLEVDQFISMLRRLDSRAPLQLKLIMADQNRRANLTERALIVEAYLRTLNPDWVDGWFEYNAAESALRIGGSGLRRLATQQSVVDGLRLRKLDVSDSEVEELWRESGYVLESLDVHNTPMTQNWFLRRFIHLKTLLVSPNQFTAEQLQVLPDGVKIIERE